MGLFDFAKARKTYYDTKYRYQEDDVNYPVEFGGYYGSEQEKQGIERELLFLLTEETPENG